MAKSVPYSNEADYVVVGSGSSGAAIAARIAQSGASVIVLEAGKSDDQFLVKKPGMIGPMHAVPQLKAKVDWGFYSTPQKHLLDRRMPVPRGKVVGGSSSINGMVYVRGNRANYDSWAAEGNTGWSADDVNAAYLRMEDFEDGANDYRGAGGPIRITRNKAPQEGTLHFIQSTSDALGVKVLDDYNAESQEGVARMQQNAADGLRYSASRGYIHHLAPPTLQLQSEVMVNKVVIDNGRATGVEVTDKGGGRRTVRAGKEVILSAGFVGSAQLLMLSGIGHAQHLRDHGIDVVADLPVGDNLHDHMFHALTFHTTSTKMKGNPFFFAKGLVKEITRGGTFMANSVFESVAFVRTSQATDVPDLQLHLLPWSYVSPNQDAPIRHDVDPRTSITLLATLIYPKSRGTLRLASTDPTAQPLIDFQYLADPADLEVLAEGSEMVREIMGGAAMGGHVKEEIHPGSNLTGQPLRDAILNRATSVYHGVGTCRMGVDELAVVGPDLKVRGVEGLRVCDASIMPSITGGNTNAPAIMIGERGADFVLGESVTMSVQRPASITDAFVQKLVERVPSTSGGTWKLTEVYTGDVLVELPQSTPADIEAAFAAAREAQREWASWSVRKRLKVFKKAHRLMVDNAHTTADLIQVESGKNRRMALEETCDPPMVISHYLKRAAKLLAPVKRGGPVPVVSTSTEIRQPKGVVGIIAPWNFPFATGISDAMPALMAGNAVVLKPDNKTALSPLYGISLMEQAGLPKGLFQVVCGEGPDVGPTLIDNANYVMFTGSTATGRVIGERAGRNLIGCCLELGGKNPMIVLDDVNVEEWVQGSLFGVFGNTGQICMHIERMYLPDSRYDELKAAFVAGAEGLTIGAAYDFGPELGSLVSVDHMHRVLSHVEDAVAKGATIVTGGKPRPDIGPAFFEPTVLENVTTDMLCGVTETFGPVVALHRYRTVDEAIALANDTDYGLNASVWGTDLDRAAAVGARIEAGNVNINDTLAAAYASKGTPSGGVKQSGVGARHGDQGLLKYTDVQNLAVLKKQVMGPRPGQDYDAYAKQMLSGLKMMRRTRIR